MCPAGRISPGEAAALNEVPILNNLLIVSGGNQISHLLALWLPEQTDCRLSFPPSH